MEKDPTQFDIKPKMSMSDDGGLAELLITPDDLGGLYDYIPDVKSMALSATTDQSEALSRDLEMILNPGVQQMLATEGVKVKVKELLISIMDSHGRQNASKLFEDVPQQVPGQTPGMPLNAQNGTQVQSQPQMPQPGMQMPGQGLPVQPMPPMPNLTPAV
jgi:hypothetical protein